MQGFRVMTTDVSGSYIFGAIPPGDYKVQFTMESLQNVTRSVHVGLSAVTRVDADMKMSAVSETVTVTAQAPLIENTSAATKTNFDQHEIETLPTGRNYTSVVQVTPGVSTDTSNNNAYGYNIGAIYEVNRWLHPYITFSNSYTPPITGSLLRPDFNQSRKSKPSPPLRKRSSRTRSG